MEHSEGLFDSFLFGFLKDKAITAQIGVLPDYDGDLQPDLLLPENWKGKYRQHYLVSSQAVTWLILITPEKDDKTHFPEPLYWGMHELIHTPFIVLLFNRYSKKLKGFHCDTCADLWLQFIIDQQEYWKHGYETIRRKGIGPKSLIN